MAKTAKKVASKKTKKTTAKKSAVPSFTAKTADDRKAIKVLSKA
jgi:hypothetical protein